MASVTLHGKTVAFPLTVDSTATISKNDLVTLDASGNVIAIAASAVATGLCVALANFTDDEYDGTQTQIPVARLGEDVLVEIAFNNSGGTNSLAQADIGGGPFALNSNGSVDLDTTVGGVFIPYYPGAGTAIGDASGTLVGVFTDAGSFGS